MNYVNILRYILSGTAILLLLISLLPLIRSNQWYIRIFDYPRSQKFWVNLAVLIALAFLSDLNNPSHVYFLGVIFLNQVYLATQIWKYTPIAPIQMKNKSESVSSPIRLLIANVLQTNRESERLYDLVRQLNPDIILLVETDYWWDTATRALDDTHPFSVKVPLENTYGMLLFSRFKIARSETRYLVEDDIPSITSDIECPNGQVFRLFALHPKPPVPGESGESTERDAEILIVGKESKRCALPVIVAGDLNDVAWSYTTKLFLKVSSLLDPRIGRGFFSTFHADYRLMRWPLDHVFCSSHFYLHDLKRLPSIGSDHFPIFIEVGLMPEEIASNRKEELQADKHDIKVANDKIEEAKQ